MAHRFFESFRHHVHDAAMQLRTSPFKRRMMLIIVIFVAHNIYVLTKPKSPSALKAEQQAEQHVEQPQVPTQ